MPPAGVSLKVSPLARQPSRLRGTVLGVPDVPVIRTPRLLLRGWRSTDLEPFAQLNADEEVMEHFPKPLTRQESDELAGRIASGFAHHGFGLWAVEDQDGKFIGFTGLAVPALEAAFMPATEVGRRLARSAWGHGYATEAATGALAFAFDRASLAEVVSFTAATNGRSQNVMRRLGMTRTAEDDGIGHCRTA